MSIPNYKFHEDTKQRLLSILGDPRRISVLMCEDRSWDDDFYEKPKEPSVSHLIRLKESGL